MHCFYTSNSVLDGTLLITGEDVNHIKNVLRKDVNDTIVVCDGDENEYLCSIERFEKDAIVTKVIESKKSENELPVEISLFQGIPKKDKMELIIQKAVELGATSIVPVVMKRCIVKLEGEDKESKKCGRWQLIAESAAKQSGRGKIPTVERPVHYADAIKEASKNGIVFVPFENAKGMTSFKEGIQKVIEKLRTSDEKQKVSIFIGPEGGFDDDEIEIAKNAGALIVSLGKRILRTETAGFTALSILMYEIECENDRSI